MTGSPFRFLHAADFHLEQPLGGVAELPDHLRDLFLEAPYLAAERVFETAAAQSVDFIVLSGDLLDPHLSGPRGPIFLLEQFARLNERGIAVYWAGGHVDAPEAWPLELKLPPNVHRFANEHVEQRLHHRQSQPVANLVGQSRRRRRLESADFRSNEPGLFSIAVAHGPADAEVFEQPRIHYWALGGRHTTTSLSGDHRLAHDPGTPQGRGPDEPGAHGCTLVHVDGDGGCDTSFVATDFARWHEVRIDLRDDSTREQAAALLRDKLKSLVVREPGMDLLVSVRLAGYGSLWRQLRRGPLAAELLSGLRSEFGFRSPTAWTVSLEAEPASLEPDERWEDQTLLGSFLHAAARLDEAAESANSQAVNLDKYLSDDQWPGSREEFTRLDDPRQRQRVLREAATLGLGLLSGEEQLQ